MLQHLESAPFTYGSNTIYIDTKYTLYDIDKNGIPELIDESRVVLGKYSKNLKENNYLIECFNYSLSDHSLDIEGMVSLVR